MGLRRVYSRSLVLIGLTSGFGGGRVGWEAMMKGLLLTTGAPVDGDGDEVGGAVGALGDTEAIVETFASVDDASGAIVVELLLPLSGSEMATAHKRQSTSAT